MSEIEIKFVTRNDPRDAFTNKIVPLLESQGNSVSQPKVKRLQNDYYDTPEQIFEKNKIGFRVRGCDGVYEQTVKTSGKVNAGLHERAEYNVNLSQNEPDLTLFDNSVWPTDWHIDELNNQLSRQFSTHFTRTAYIVDIADARVEVVFDEGSAATDKASSPIHEIELELLEGDVHALFVLASQMLGHLEMRLSDVSKAAQGYQLMHGLSAKIKPLPAHLSLESKTSTEDAFGNAVLCALAHWQAHEHMFIETNSVKMLGEVNNSIRMLLQTVGLFLPVLQCPDLLTLHKQLLNFSRAWSWQDDLQSLRYLLSKKSVFHKGLSRQPSLLSYLQGRQAGLVHAHAPEHLFFSAEATRIKLSISEVLYSKPWRNVVKGYDIPVMEHAKGWLSQGWQTMQQSMPEGRTFTAADYIAVETQLNQALLTGFILADLFASTRGQYRAPWLDIKAGIDELKALMMLRQALKEAELESHDDLGQWAEEKVDSLIKVMERSRSVAVNAEVYW